MKFVKIKTIKKLDKRETVYDMTVSYNHNFIANGILVHNCFEFLSFGYPYSSCNLGSINIYKLIKNKKFDWEKYEDIITKSYYFLNNVIDKNNYGVDKIKDFTMDTRPIGLGTMGIAHALIAMHIPYNSKEAVEFISYITRYATLKCMDLSCQEAKKKEPYKLYNEKSFIEANQRLFYAGPIYNIDTDKLLDKIKKNGVRNIGFTSIAPNGSLSTIANTTGGIEPIFALTYIRKVEKENKKYEEIFITDPLFESYLDKTFNLEEKNKILSTIGKSNGSCKKIKEIPDEIKELYLTAEDLSIDAHMDILEASYKNCSYSVSKTINLPNNATEEDVSNAYKQIYDRKIMGATVYRDGCREGILVHSNSNCSEIINSVAPIRPISLKADVYHFTILKHKHCVAVGMMGCKPYEIFTWENYNNDGDTFVPKNIISGQIVKIEKQKYKLISDSNEEYILTNGHSDPSADGLTRTISKALRYGTPVHEIVEEMEKVTGPLISFAKAIGRALKHYIIDGTETGDKCPDCGSKLMRISGCVQCSNCTYSKCG